jgi:hypothetical protein
MFTRDFGPVRKLGARTEIVVSVRVRCRHRRKPSRSGLFSWLGWASGEGSRGQESPRAPNRVPNGPPAAAPHDDEIDRVRSGLARGFAHVSTAPTRALASPSERGLTAGPDDRWSSIPSVSPAATGTPASTRTQSCLSTPGALWLSRRGAAVFRGSSSRAGAAPGSAACSRCVDRGSDGAAAAVPQLEQRPQLLSPIQARCEHGPPPAATPRGGR